MDAIEPILPKQSILPEVRAAERSKPIHRDGQRGGGAYGEQRRRRNEEEAVEVDVEGVEASDEADADGSVSVLELPAPRLVDFTADGDPAPTPQRRVDLTDDDEPEPPTRHIDLSA
jgi:hypothetical protein